MTEVSTAVLEPPTPTVGWASGPLGEAQVAQREISRQTARRARAIADFAAARPATDDRQPGEPGAMSADRRASRAEVLRPVSEWAARELSIALDLTAQRAEEELARALTLVHRLPRVLDALGTGLLHDGHLWCLLEHVAPIADDAVRTRVQDELVEWMSARGRVTTPAQLGDRVRRVVARENARDVARDLGRALARRGVSVRADRTPGMSAVTILCTTPEAQALVRTLSARVDALASGPGDARTRGQKLVDCALDLVLRPGQTDLPPVQVLLTVVASVQTLLGGDAPGEVHGQVVPAELVRALLAALTGARDEPAETGPTGTGPTEEAPAEREPTAEGSLAAGGPVGDLTGGDRTAGWDEPIPAEVLERWAAEEDARAAGQPPPDWRRGPAATGWWSAADRAVDDVGQALLVLERALGHARRTVRTAETADAADEAAWCGSPSGRMSAARDALGALAAATDGARSRLADLLSRTAGGGLADRPRVALTDAVSGALLALTDLPALRRAERAGSGLAAPGGTDGYRPGATLDRHVRARDRRCRFPGCRRPVPVGGELDHVHPWPAGPTAAANLAGLCTTDHRGKHQAPGWTHSLAADGTLTVTTPSGLTATTQPPPY